MFKLKSLTIEKFRRFKNDATIEIGDKLTLIVGQNATSKSTLLGMICQPFEFTSEFKVYTQAYDEINKKDIHTISGKFFQSDFSDVFRMSLINDDPETKQYIYNINYEADGANNSLVVKSEKRTDQKSNNVRFVVGKTRKKGEGNYPHPVIYLGLNRLYPLANSKKINIDDQYNLSSDEKQFYSKWQKEITILNENIYPEYISTDTKDFLGCKTDEYDAETNSAGQDNLGQIITAILSFKRLKEILKENYKGGILLIDELDASLHILAQEKLVKFLIYSANEFNLQIICTTHSQKIIEDCSRIYKRDTTIISLYRRGNNVLIKNNASYNDIINELAAINPKSTSIAYTTVLFEDYVAVSFFKYITRNKFNNFLKMYPTINANNEAALPADTLLRLSTRKIPEFSKILYIVDADQKNNIKNRRNKNIIALPGQYALEKEMYIFLNNLDESDPFWSQELGQYNKQTCFRDFVDISLQDDISTFKSWFKSQESNWSRGNAKLYKYWISKNKNEVKSFIKDFDKIYRSTISKPIEPNLLKEIFDFIDKL